MITDLLAFSSGERGEDGLEILVLDGLLAMSVKNLIEVILGACQYNISVQNGDYTYGINEMLGEHLQQF